jgi:hypothetical protein
MARVHQGQALVLLAFVFTFLLVAAALAVDVGALWLQKRQLQNIADSAAIVGAQFFDGSNPDAPRIQLPAGSDKAAQYVNGHGLACPGSGCTITAPVPEYGVDQDQYIRVTVRRTLSFTFGRALGVPSESLEVSATARAIRYKSNGQAVIALSSPTINPNVTVEGGGASDRFTVTGDVVSHGSILRGFGSSRLALTDGRALAETTISSSLVIEPSGSAVAPYAAQATFPDPLRNVTWPSYPSTSCGSAPPRQPGSGSINWEYFGGTVEVGTVLGVPERVLLWPGHYCSISIRNGWVIFASQAHPSVGVGSSRALFFVDSFLNTNLDPATGTPQMLMWSSYNGGLAANDGMYLTTRTGNITITDDANERIHLELKGHPSYEDVLFHSRNGGNIFVTNGEPSNIVGSIYGPASVIRISGNACSVNCGARVTRNLGGSAATQAGGRVIGWRITLVVNMSTATMHYGVDFPPIEDAYIFAPTLMPNSP